MKHTKPDTAATDAAQNAAAKIIQAAAPETRKIQKLEYQPVVGNNPGMDIEAYVKFTIATYEEAYGEASDLEERDRRYVAQMSWRCVLPIMDSPHAAKAFIACVAVGHARGWLKPDDARALAYTAQLALAALKGGRN